MELTNSDRFRVDDTGNSIGIFTRELPQGVDHRLLQELADKVINGEHSSVRLCLHDGPSADFHTMIIVDSLGTFYRPHKHRYKGECFHIIQGSLGLVLFDEDGQIQEACTLSAEQMPIYRLPVDVYHTVLPLTNLVIYHESKLGPYLESGDSIYPTWSPEGSDTAEIRRRIEDLLGVDDL